MRWQVTYCTAFFVAWLALSPLFAQKKIAKLPPAIHEISGLSLRKDTLWTHNDSGGKPRLFALNLQGQLLDSVVIPGAENVDWEEISQDEAGNFYLFDSGNNGHARKDLTIYKWHPQAGLLGRITYRFADQEAYPPAPVQRHFNTEAAVWFRDSLFLFTKNQMGTGNYWTYIYAIPDQPGDYVLSCRDSIWLEKRVPTAAALSPDGKTLVLTTYNFVRKKGLPPRLPRSLFVCRDFEGTKFSTGQLRKYRMRTGPFTQIEAVEFRDDHSLWLGSEAVLFRPARLYRMNLKQD
ncbi:MAG: hypothetical protein AAFR61_30345 [Bacteroidota bacterium]